MCVCLVLEGLLIEQRNQEKNVNEIPYDLFEIYPAEYVAYFCGLVIF